MESFQKNILFRLKDEATNKNFRAKIVKVEQLPGVSHVSPVNNSLMIYYDPYAVSEKFLETCLGGMGFVPAKEKKQGLLARWIHSLAKSNQKNLGNQRLDCCNLKQV